MLDIEILGIVLLGIYSGFIIAIKIDGKSLSGPLPLHGVKNETHTK